MENVKKERKKERRPKERKEERKTERKKESNNQMKKEGKKRKKELKNEIKVNKKGNGQGGGGSIVGYFLKLNAKLIIRVQYAVKIILRCVNKFLPEVTSSLAFVEGIYIFFVGQPPEAESTDR